MNSTVFGEFTFNTGWKSRTTITLFGKAIEVVVKAKAYYEKDGITAEQERAFADWDNLKNEKLRIAEKLLTEYSRGNADERFKMKTLLFDRDGDYALLFDDRENEDDGVAVCLAPIEKVVPQDEYL
jgi:hypothetical protein